MTDLGIPASTIEVLRRHQFTIQKKYGQNFLIDKNVLERSCGLRRLPRRTACWR